MFGMSEILTTVLTETQNYPLSACISDTGGAIGLFLGLNMIGLICVLIMKSFLTVIFKEYFRP